MPLTCSFREIVVDRARHDPAFLAALIEGAKEALDEGDADMARTLLRDVVDAIRTPDPLGALAKIGSGMPG